MSVVAKLYVAETKRAAGSPDAVSIVLAAVTRGEENKSWAEATPMAQFTMTIQNPSAAAQFALGQEFYVTFESAGVAPSLADGHDYEPSEYERDNGDRYGSARCARCGAKAVSHQEPLRSQIVRLAGMGALEAEAG